MSTKMESQEKKSKPSGSKSQIETPSSESDTSFAEGEENDEDESSSEDDEDLISSDDHSDDDENYFAEDFDFDYMAQSVRILEEHADVSLENSIVLNRKLQDTLEDLRSKIITMLNKCREIYEENQQKLANPSKMVSYLKGIGSCGRPFFKDKAGRHCPPNADYIHRSEVERELFPSDLELYPHFTWTARDKVGILQGIKEQAIEYIERKDAYDEKLKKSTTLSKKVKIHSMKLNKLLENVDEGFEIDWNQISVHNLGSRHTANSCMASWNAYLKPEINRNEWTEEEEIKLNELAKKYQFQDWIAIASEMPGRSDYQCFVQYQTVVSIKMREDKGERWTKEEDDLLLSLVEKNRMGNLIRWNPICSQLPNRTKKQCFARWKYSINPNISRALFTPEEDCIILAAVEEFGENFNCFPKDLFPNRTVVQIRNRYNNSIKTRGQIKHWSPEDDQLLLDLIKEHGEHDWTKIATSIKSHTRTSCRTRYLTISKFFKDNPNATVEDIPRKKRRARSNVTKNNWVETITNLKNNEDKPPLAPEPIENKTPYRSKLRLNELSWYNFLKYSYDFKFGEGYSKVPKCLASFEFIRYVFQCQLNWPVALHGSYAKGFVAVTLEKLIRLHEQDEKTLVFERPEVGYRLPPNYCTLLAFRGLCIQASFSNTNEDMNAMSVCKFPADVIEARNKFRQRLQSLLYKTTLLSRMEPKSSVEQNKFEVIFNKNTGLGQATAINLAELKVAQLNRMAENLKIAQEKADRNRHYKAKLKRLGKLEQRDEDDDEGDYDDDEMADEPRTNRETIKRVQEQKIKKIADSLGIPEIEKEKSNNKNLQTINTTQVQKIIESRRQTRTVVGKEIVRVEDIVVTPNGNTNDLRFEQELPPDYETLTIIETKPSAQELVEQNTNRKRTFEESFMTFEDSSQSLSCDAHLETKYIKREKE